LGNITVPPGRYAKMRKLDSTDVYAEGNEGDNYDSLGVSRFISGETAIVDGTPGPDRIILTAHFQSLGEVTDRVFELTINGVAETLHSEDGVGGFDIRGGDGDDTVIIKARDASARADLFDPIRVDGGAGNDRIAGNLGNETLIGGSGKDKIDGNGGNDHLYGSGGNDHLSGGAGSDRLYGDNGDDYLNGGSSGDRLKGGAGRDTLAGESGADLFVTRDGQRDVLFGGGNRDSVEGDASDLLDSVERVL
jgi:Ca2+-binding RTX toxin-like protein